MKRFKVGAIGTAWATRSPLPTFQQYPRTELVAVCSAHLDRARSTADQFGAPLAFDDYREMVKLPELDIIYICSPVFLHLPMVLAAAEAGKHILCEKPLAVNSAEGTEMVNAVESRGLAHAVAITMRFFPYTIAIRRLVEDGFVGELRQFMVRQWMPVGPGTKRPWTWLHEASLGGGLVGAMGSHYIDLVRSLFGEFAQVSALARTHLTDSIGPDGEIKKATAEDAFNIQATLRNGAMISINYGLGLPPAAPFLLEIYGTKGSIVMDHENNLLVAEAGDRELRAYQTPDPGFPDEVEHAAVPRFGKVIHNLLTSIEEGKQRSPDLVDALRCQEVIDAVHRSAREGATVHLSELSPA